MIEISKNLLALFANHQAGPDMKPVVVLEGSTRSAKTWSAIEYLCTIAIQYGGMEIFAGRHDATTAGKTIARDLVKILRDKFPAAWESGTWNKQEKIFRFANGSFIEIGGTQDESKLHGASYDIVWLNEAMEINYSAYRQLSMRTRFLTILDYNPSLTVHWVFDHVLSRADCLYIHSTYKDNPHLERKQIREIESTEPTPANISAGTADEWYWRVYGLGLRGIRKGVIFKNWRIVDDWPDISATRYHGFGLDFGFSEDPSAMPELCVWNDLLYVRGRLHETGLVVTRSISDPGMPSIEGRMIEMGIDKNARIIADSARPDSIAELKTAGYNVWPCVKGPGSVQAGIDILRSWTICVHRDSQALIAELQNYTWRQRSDGVWLDEPIDKYNHYIDAMRYWASVVLIRGRGREQNQRRNQRPKVRKAVKKW